jgi:hypothetical protein
MKTTSLHWPPGLPRLLLRWQCPLCTSIAFTEAEQSAMDPLFRMLHLFPVRCCNCWRRYYSLSNRGDR